MGWMEGGLGIVFVREVLVFEDCAVVVVVVVVG